MNVNGDMVSYTSKTAKIKKVILLNCWVTSPFFIFAVYDV